MLNDALTMVPHFLSVSLSPLFWTMVFCLPFCCCSHCSFGCRIYYFSKFLFSVLISCRVTRFIAIVSNILPLVMLPFLQYVRFPSLLLTKIICICIPRWVNLVFYAPIFEMGYLNPKSILTTISVSSRFQFNTYLPKLTQPDSRWLT